MKPKSIELFAFNRNHNLQYEGKCKLRIDKLSKMLLVEPVNEEFKMISAMFKWDFVMNKNIMFVLGEHELNDFGLVFDEERRCKKVYGFIVKNKEQHDVEKEIICQRFLHPFCEKIAKNDGTTAELEKVLVQWIDKCENEEKEGCIALLKEKNIYDIIYPQKKFKEKMLENDIQYSATSHLFANEDSKGKYHRNRKRRCFKIDTDSNASIPCKKQKFLRTYPLCINQNQLKIVNLKNKRRRQLLIFSTAEENQCYQFSWNHKRNIYYCIGCKTQGKEIVAISDKDKNGFECVKMEDKKHICAPIPYIPENYTEMKIIKKPEYEILENCNVKSGKLLVVFDQNDKNQCWEFRLFKPKLLFRCRKCGISAKLVNKDSGNELIKLNSANHTCKTRPFNRQSYYEFNEFVLSPDFEVRNIFMLGKERKRLIIFDKNDRNLCHVHNYSNNGFLCYGCYKKKLTVSAKILQNSDGENYVMLSKINHICKLRPYSEIATKQIILHPPDFELMENTSNGVKKIFLFKLGNRNLCYLFSEEKKNRKRYACQGCANIRKQKDKNAKEVFLYLCKDENGKNYVQLDDKSHICNPRKYEPEKYAKKESHDYFFYCPRKQPSSVIVAISHPENPNLCFKLNNTRSTSLFVCNACSAKRKRCNARIKQDSEGKEYFSHDYKKHACQPVKVSSIRGSEYIILKRDEINLKEKNKLNDGCKIIKLTNFELRPNKNGIENGLLFIFHSKNRNVGYKYCLIKNDNRYRCSKSSVCTATAKLQIQENGEQCVVMRKKEHTCQPINLTKMC